MNILFIHQNFPGQFKHLAPALVQAGHNVVALTPGKIAPDGWGGVKIVPYNYIKGQAKELHPWVIDFESKIIRADSCFRAASALKEKGYEPDVIIAATGWGEALFLRDVWPKARFGLFYEFYYNAVGYDAGFDLEYEDVPLIQRTLRTRLKNVHYDMHLKLGDLGLCPTQFQANSFPRQFRDNLHVIHEGVDTNRLRPNSAARFEIPDGGSLSANDEVITFVNRNLEPLRGYHIFMRALPGILKKRPNARVVICGGGCVVLFAGPNRCDELETKIHRRSARPNLRCRLGKGAFCGNAGILKFSSDASSEQRTRLSDLSLRAELVCARSDELRSGHCCQQHSVR